MDAIPVNWLVLAVTLAAVLVVARWLLSRASASGRRDARPDMLDQGAAPAQRNQALIDAVPAAEALAPQPIDIMGGIGEVIAAAVHEELIEAVAQPQPAPSPQVAASGDDLSRIKGLGPKLQEMLPALGLSTYAQIAALGEAELDALDARLGAFAGRPRRDNWVEQARLLVAGDMAGFEERFGKV